MNTQVQETQGVPSHSLREKDFLKFAQSIKSGVDTNIAELFENGQMSNIDYVELIKALSKCKVTINGSAVNQDQASSTSIPHNGVHPNELPDTSDEFFEIEKIRRLLEEYKSGLDEVDSTLSKESIKFLSDVVIYMKYSRYLKKLRRKETFKELIERNKAMHMKRYPMIPKERFDEVYEMVEKKMILPSMRSLQFGGEAIEKNNARIYNCCFMLLNDILAFSESKYLLMSGDGVGFSVQRRHVEKLPPVIHPNPLETVVHVIPDDTKGWADSIKILLQSYLHDDLKTHKPTVVFDYSKIRPKGAELVTSGGKAPGPEPLKKCHQLIVQVLKSVPCYTKMEPIDCHDIMCIIAGSVLAGGIRRSSLISLFSPDDKAMMECKNSKISYGKTERLVREIASQEATELGYPNLYTFDKNVKELINNERIKGEQPLLVNTILKKTPNGVGVYEEVDLRWWDVKPWRSNSNNSVALLRGNVTKEEFFNIWNRIREGGAGEPGIFWTNDLDLGTNPCGEVSLNDCQMCNLSEINDATVEDQADLNRRARGAAFLGTLQAGYTDFSYLRPKWKENTEREALLGVSNTGIATGKVMELDFEDAAGNALDENKKVAEMIGINPTYRATCIKPAGTSSLVLGCSSGIHTWHAEYYYRRVRINKTEPIYAYLKIMVPDLIEDDVYDPDNTAVLTTVIKAPPGAITRKETCIEFLNRVKKVYTTWVKGGHVKGVNSHNVSTTVSIRDNEWEEAFEWMWENRDSYGGIAVMPYDNKVYKQAPFEECTKEDFEREASKLKAINLQDIIEEEDNTNFVQTNLACSGGYCEILQ